MSQNHLFKARVMTKVHLRVTNISLVLILKMNVMTFQLLTTLCVNLVGHVHCQVQTDIHKKHLPKLCGKLGSVARVLGLTRMMKIDNDPEIHETQ